MSFQKPAFFPTNLYIVLKNRWKGKNDNHFMKYVKKQKDCKKTRLTQHKKIPIRSSKSLSVTVADQN